MLQTVFVLMIFITMSVPTYAQTDKASSTPPVKSTPKPTGSNSSKPITQPTNNTNNKPTDKAIAKPKDKAPAKTTAKKAGKSASTGCEIWHSPSFSPNGDRRDDIFLPTFQNCNGRKTEFWIINNKGETVFKTSDLSKGWDGNLAGKPQPAGDYMWQYKMLGPKGWFNSMGKIKLVR